MLGNDRQNTSLCDAYLEERLLMPIYMMKEWWSYTVHRDQAKPSLVRPGGRSPDMQANLTDFALSNS
ncbi:MAG: hypothetical protein K0S45_332 [Nitrospira sp.]|jgi:hypothetical protein|nr:hypothetical protein [Nitrospira sp.]